MQGVEFKITKSDLAKLTRFENRGMFETGPLRRVDMPLKSKIISLLRRSEYQYG